MSQESNWISQGWFGCPDSSDIFNTSELSTAKVAEVCLSPYRDPGHDIVPAVNRWSRLSPGECNEGNFHQRVNPCTGRGPGLYVGLCQAVFFRPRKT